MPNDITKGLNIRPKYYDLIHYLMDHQEKIKYPNRSASNIVIEVMNEVQEARNKSLKKRRSIQSC